MSRRKIQQKANNDFVYYFDSRKKQKTKSPKSQKEDLIDVDDTLDVKTTAESLSIDENDVDDDSFIDVQSDDSDSSIDSEAAFKALSMQREKPIVKGKNKGSNGAGYSSEEEKWLDAVEEGRLEEDMLLKRMKDPKSMTARQKARIDRPLDTHASVEISSKPVLTEEQEEKRAARARERKKVVDVRKEEEKRRTVEKLLFKRGDKTESTKKKIGKTGRLQIAHDLEKPWVASYSLHITPIGKFISSPPGLNYPLDPRLEKAPPLPVYCGNYGCQNLKKYVCSKTHVPLCSLECYRSNLRAVLEGRKAIA
ncbi:INO80 complex subunit B-like [Artemia franciscana]|uniref:INO80 complex subunit B-like n=1 Tax=Artemia franciscana TaxID=6661 RepID=UPI0032D9B484